MSPGASEWLVLAVAVGALGLIVTDRLRTDLVALLVMLVLAFSGAVTPEEAVSGFSRPAVLTLAGLFVLTAALDRAGVGRWVSERLNQVAGGSEGRVVLGLMLSGACLSLVMNPSASGAVLLPAGVDLARRNGIPVSRVLMPLGFGTVLGGMATVFTTANVVLSGAIHDQVGGSLGLGDFFPTGSVMVAVGVAYMVLLGRHLLPRNESSARQVLNLQDLSAVYELDQRLWEVRIHPGCPMAGQTLAGARLGERLGLTVLAIWNGPHARFAPSGEEVIGQDDILLVLGAEEQVQKLAELDTTIGRGRTPGQPDLPVVMVEAVIPPRSQAIGRSLKEVRFRSRYGLTVVALWRSGRSHRTGVGKMKLEAGDALLVVGDLERILELTSDPDYLVVDTPSYEPVSVARSAWTLMVAAAVLACAGVGLVPMAQATVAGAVFLVLTGYLSANQAYSAIDWRVIVMIAAMDPLAAALQHTGWTQRLGDLLATHLHGPLAVVAGLYLVSALATQVLGGQVSAVLMGPMAVAVALQLGLTPKAVAVLVTVGCSNAFLTLASHPVNALMAGPGGYRGWDFLRVGWGMTLACFLAAMAMAAFYWKV